MSVIIKGMDKPKDCRHCPLYAARSMVCTAKCRVLQTCDSPDGPPPEWCPIVEIVEEDG